MGYFRSRLTDDCMKILLVSAALLMALAMAQAAHADEPPSRDAYRAIVTGALALVERAEKDALTESRRPLLSEAANSLTSVREVKWDTGARLPVNNDELASLLRDAADSSDKVRAVRARLAALRDALGSPVVAAPGEHEFARLADMLDKPPFRAGAAPDNWLLRQFLAWLDALLGDAVRGVFEFRQLIMVLGFLLIAIVIAYFARTLRRQAAGEASLPAGADSAQTPTAAQVLASAQQISAAGDFRSAVRLLFLSSLLWLDEHGHLRYDKSLTNREYLRAVHAQPAIRSALAPLVEAFDRIWYGFAPISAAEFEQYRQAVDAVRRL